MRRQYHLRATSDGFDAWDVDRLIEISRNLAIERVALSEIDEIDCDYWFAGSGEIPTVRKVADHARLIGEVDPAYPIILSHDGRVMDGMHRIARAVLEGRVAISAVRLPSEVEPDYRNCQPDELPY